MLIKYIRYILAILSAVFVGFCVYLSTANEFMTAGTIGFCGYLFCSLEELIAKRS